MRQKRAVLWKKFYRKNRYYHTDLEFLARNLIPADATVIEFGCKGGELLSKLPNKIKYGVDNDADLIKKARNRYKLIKFFVSTEIYKKNKNIKFDYIYISNYFSSAEDIQLMLHLMKKISHKHTKIIVVSFNYLWKPLIDIGSKFGLVFPQERSANWLTKDDLNNFFHIESYQLLKSGSRFIFPYKIALLSTFINRFVSQLPFFNIFSLSNYSIYSRQPDKREYSVSIIIPARNEEGNIKGVLKKIPRLGKSTEVIFVEGHSKDNTYKVIKGEIDKYHGVLKVRLIKQKGIGKGNAVREGFSVAKNELLIIFDADLTVDPKELPKFYKAISLGLGDLIMGSRLVYPMEKLAMRALNIIGNIFFSEAFSYLLGQRIRDTLCGTKLILRKEYLRIVKNRKLFGDFDPFGDFDLIFGAAKLNLRILEIPIRYKQRVYGSTNISRFNHGMLLIKMVFFAAKNLKFV